MVSTAKNTFYLLVAYIYQKLISLFYFILLARYLGAGSFGKYTFALSFAALFSVFMEFGLFQVLTREVARDKSKTRAYFGNILTFNLLVGLFTLVLIYVLINILNYPLITRNLVYLTALVIFLDTLALSLYHVFRGHLNLKFESIGIIVHKTVMLIAGLVLIFLKAKLILMILPLLFASCFYLFNAVLFLKKKLGIWPIPRFNKSVLKPLLKLSWPFFLAAIFAKLYATSDTILLSCLVGDKFVGWYNAANKLTTAFLLLIAGSLSSALYPSMSYYFVRSKQALNRIFGQAVFYLMLITIPLAFGLIVLSKPIILFIYGQEYLPAVSVLIFLACSVPFMFLDYIVAALLNACEKQKVNTLIHGIGVGFFIVFNLILIPLFAHIGSAIAVLAGFLIIFVLEIIWARKIVQIDKKYLLKKVSLIFSAGLVMGAALWLIKDSLHVLFCVLIGIVVYFIISCLFGLVQKQDFQSLKKIVQFKSSPFSPDQNSGQRQEGLEE